MQLRKKLNILDIKPKKNISQNPVFSNRLVLSTKFARVQKLKGFICVTDVPPTIVGRDNRSKDNPELLLAFRLLQNHLSFIARKLS